MADFRGLSMEQKHEAFERAKYESRVEEGTLVLITEDLYDTALRFIRYTFMKDETICKSVNMQWSPVWNALWLNIFKDNLSVAVLDDVSGDMIALRAIRIQYKNFKYDASLSDDIDFKILISAFKCCEEIAKCFDRFQVEQAFHFFGFGVRKEYSNKGLGDRMFKIGVNFLRHLVPSQFCVKGDTTSAFSSRVYEKNNFVKLYELPYSEFLMEGKQVILNTGVHRSLTIWATQINATRH